MHRRSLSKDAVLWWRGDAARTLGVIERGHVGVRTEAGVIDVLPAGSVIGESALLDEGGALPQRTADMVVLEDGTEVVEYDLDEFRTRLPHDVSQQVLRALMAQTARNLLAVAAARPHHALIGAFVDGYLELIAGVAQRLPEVENLEQFLAAFRLLYRQREGSDRARRDLTGPGQGDTSTQPLELLNSGRHRVRDAGLQALLEACLQAESNRRPAAEGA